MRNVEQKKPVVKILPSLLAADMGALAEACQLAEKAGADGIHVDIMDGHFVRNLSMGPDIVQMARENVRGQLSVHLMVTHPQHFVDVFAKAGADVILIHIEAQCDPDEVLAQIRSRGVRAGITLNPETPADTLRILRHPPDEVLCMTVHPGFGGQEFIPEVLPKIRQVREIYPDLDVSVDGGIDAKWAAECARNGANVFLAGTTLFGASDLRTAIATMRSAVCNVWDERG